jgi:hypothetical protein
VCAQSTFAALRGIEFLTLHFAGAPLDRTGIIAYQYQVSDDGNFAVAEFVAMARAGLAPILTSTNPAGAARRAARSVISVKNRPLGERCITYGSPQLTAGYQSYYQIVETPGAIMIILEMFRDVRVVKMDGRPHPPSNVQGWLGDSIGHWEGDTLVVDSTNYRPRAFQSISSEKLHIVERFTRQDANTLRYEIP